jgi:hypothetical protein
LERQYGRCLELEPSRENIQPVSDDPLSHRDPSKDEIPSALMPVARRAYQIMMDILTTHGNNPGTEQREVLLYLLLLYFKMATGSLDEDDRRVVAALPTGYGKTTSIVAFITALHEFGIEDLSVTVAASKVEALAELKRELIKSAGESVLAKIGLLHSYKFDPAEAERARKHGLPLPDGYASEPATWENPSDRQFLLVTHARIRNDGPKGLETYNTYRGQERSLVIYDESLLPADVWSFELNRLAGGIAYMQAAMDNRKDLKPVIAWLNQARDALTGTFSKYTDSENTEGGLVSLPALSEADQLEYLRRLPKGDYSIACESCLERAGTSVRLHPSYSGLVATYSVVIPEALKRVVVLDASYLFRDLVKDDVRTKPIQSLPGKFQGLKPFFEAGLKRYPNMTIRTMNARWGRQETDKEFSVRDFTKRRFVNDLVRTIKGIPAQEAVLVFVYKDRGKVSQRTVLMNALEEAGIDTKGTIEVNGSEQGPRKTKPRINVATWGQETSTNDYAHCQHVILAGVLQLPNAVKLGGYLAAKDDPAHPYPKEKATSVSLTESLHLIYQAASRGTCRATDRRSEAPPMTLWLTTPTPDAIKERLREIFPKARHLTWEGDFGKQSERKVSTLTKRIRAFLQEFEAEGNTKVSTRQLKQLIPELQEVPSTSFTRAVQEVHNMDDLTWLLQGRSLVLGS